jgi:hypothetical protein
LKSRHENDQLRTQVAHLEKLLSSEENYFESRNTSKQQKSQRRQQQFPSEDITEEFCDFLSDDNYVDLNASTVSHRTASSTVTECREERELEVEDDEEEGEDEGEIEDAEIEDQLEEM